MSATLVPERARPRSRPNAAAARPARTWLPLACLYLAAVAYHALQSLGHRTPAVFTDELLFAKLAQSLAAGEGFSLRGEPFFFPAPLGVAIQSLAWLLPDAQHAYEAAKALNAAVMAAALFPAYWLARQVVSRRAALVAALAAVVAPGLLYHSYLMTDAAGYPIALLTLAVMTRALSGPSSRWEAAVVGVALLAVLTRTQFVVLPLAYLVAVGVTGAMAGGGIRAAYLRHRASCGILAAAGLLGVLTGGVVLGQYAGAAGLEYPFGELLHWTVLSAGMLPFSVGWLVAPGALLGIALLLARPRTRGEAGFAALVAVLVPLLVLEAALIATGDAGRVMERYLVCVVPLAFIAFLAYAERGAPRRLLHAAAALALGAVALVYPLATEADYRFSFDSPTLSAFGELAGRTTDGDAAAVFAGTALLASLSVAALASRRRIGLEVAVAGVLLLAVTGAAAYAADRGMTERTATAFASSPPDWLDESALGRTDFVALPGGQPHAGWNLEAWNRDLGIPIRFPGVDGDGYRSLRAFVASDGRLRVEGGAAPTRTLIVDDYGSAIELEGTVVLRPRVGLAVWRLQGEPRLRSFAEGLYHDGWASALVRYRVWSRPGGGVYRLQLSLPAGRTARNVTLSVRGGQSRTLSLRGGENVAIELSAGEGPTPAPLEIRTDSADFEGRGEPAPRLVAVRVSELVYTAL